MWLLLNDLLRTKKNVRLRVVAVCLHLLLTVLISV